MNNRTLVIGIGNDERGDDAAGLAVARLLKARVGSVQIVQEHTGDATGLLQLWRDMERVIIIDAVYSGREPGAIYRFEAGKRPIPSELLSYSTHAFSVAAAIELARVLHELPARVVLYGIEARNFKMGSGLTRQVWHAVRQVARCIVREVHVYGARITTRESPRLPTRSGNAPASTATRQPVLMEMTKADKP